MLVTPSVASPPRSKTRPSGSKVALRPGGGVGVCGPEERRVAFGIEDFRGAANSPVVRSRQETNPMLRSISFLICCSPGRATDS